MWDGWGFGAAPGLGLQPSRQHGRLHGEGGLHLPGGGAARQPITMVGAGLAWLSWEPGADGARVPWVSAGTPSLFP